MNKYLAFILLLFLTMPMCLNGQDYPGTATGIDIDRTAIGTNVGKALPNKVMTLNADKEFTGASKIGSDEIETEHISVLLGDEIEDIEYPAPIHFGYKQAIEAIKAYKNTLSNAQDIVNVTDRVTVLETNTYTKAETDNLLDEKTDTNTVSLIDDRVTVLETGVYTKVETDTLMLEKATTNDIKELENRVTIVETNFDSHINDNMVDIKHVTDTEKGLIDTALQPGATGTSTNLSEYNNDAGYITNAGVESLNSLTGGVTFEDGTNTTVRIDGQKIYIDSEGGGSGGITNFGITDKDAYRGDWADAISNVVSDTIVPVRDVSAIAAGAYHFLALKKGKVIVWGENNWGQTNIPESLNSNVSAIACGNYHSLAIKGGEVISWGNNNNGQTNVPLEAQSGVTAIAGGYFHSLALKDGGVIAWGQNNKGQTTIPDTATNGVTAISAGYYFSLALKDGGVIAWGDNQHGQTDVPIEAQSGVTDISGGSHYSLALKNGKVISWGENATNVPLEAQSGVTAIAASFSHSTAIKNGEIIKWDMDGNIVPNSITNNIISNDFKEFNIIALNESGTVEIDGPYSDSVPLELTMPSYSYTLDLHGGSAHVGGDKIDGYGISDTTAYRGDLGHALSNRLDIVEEHLNNNGCYGEFISTNSINTVNINTNFNSPVNVVVSWADNISQLAQLEVINTTTSNFTYQIRNSEGLVFLPYKVYWQVNGGGSSSGSSYVAGTYPVFMLDIGNVDGNWTDFEIKASTNNFDNMVYYYKSWTTNQNTNYYDPSAKVYYTDDYADDVRKWILKPVTNSVSQVLLSTNSVVQFIYFQPSHECAIDWQTWMNANNNNKLIWSYVRVDDIGFEQNKDKTKQRWNPVRPVSWDITPINP